MNLRPEAETTKSTLRRPNTMTTNRAFPATAAFGGLTEPLLRHRGRPGG